MKASSPLGITKLEMLRTRRGVSLHFTLAVLNVPYFGFDRLFYIMLGPVVACQFKH